MLAFLDNEWYGIVFEIKNRDEINPPSEKEFQRFVQKVELFKYALKRQGYGMLQQLMNGLQIFSKKFQNPKKSDLIPKQKKFLYH